MSLYNKQAKGGESEIACAARVHTEIISRQRNFQIMRDLTLAVIVDLHQHSKPIVLRQRNKNAYIDEMAALAAMHRKNPGRETGDREDRKMTKRAKIVLATVRRETTNLGSKSRGATRIKYEMAASIAAGKVVIKRLKQKRKSRNARAAKALQPGVQ